jgi:pyrroline-5-carboxylate reductase
VKPMRIAVLGGGVMGETLASGFLRRAEPRPEVVVAEKRAERAEDLRRLLGVEIADSRKAVRGADVVVLVVKPQDMDALLDEVGGILSPGTIVISIAAGIRSSTIEAAVGEGVHVVRAMPNTPARVDRGVTGVSPGGSCTDDALATAAALLASVGEVVEVPESLQDAVTAVSGSGPAYVFYLAEAMTSAAVELGLDEATAERMVNHTILGAAELLASSGEPAGVLRRNVTSPRGTTEAAIDTMEELGVRAGIEAGVVAARDRSRELSGS